jgi:hypothetical protein
VRVIDVIGHEVDAVKDTARMGAGENRGGQALTATQVAICEVFAASGWGEAGEQGDMIQDRRRHGADEVADVWYVGYVSTRRGRWRGGLHDRRSHESSFVLTALTFQQHRLTLVGE